MALIHHLVELPHLLYTAINWGKIVKNTVMYKRGKAVFKALTRIAGAGDNTKLHFLGKRKIIHSGILVPGRRESS